MVEEKEKVITVVRRRERVTVLQTFQEMCWIAKSGSQWNRLLGILHLSVNVARHNFDCGLFFLSSFITESNGNKLIAFPNHLFFTFP